MCRGNIRRGGSFVRLTQVLFVALWAFLLSAAGCPGDKQRTTPQAGEYEEEYYDSDTTAARLSPEMVEEIQRVFNLGRICVERCFHDYINRVEDPKIEGDVIIGVVIGTQPNPVKVWIFNVTDKLNDDGFKECLIERVKQWEFPVWGTTLEFTTPRYNLLGS